MTLKKIITTYLDVTNDCIASWSCCGNYWLHFVWPVVNFQVALILLMSIIIPMLVSATMIACPDKTSGSISSTSSRMNWVSLEAQSSVVHQSDHASSQQHHKLPSGEWPPKYLPRQKKGKTSNPSFWIVQLGLQEFAKTIDESEKCHHRVLYIQCHLVIEVLCQDLCNDQVCRG